EAGPEWLAGRCGVLRLPLGSAGAQSVDSHDAAARGRRGEPDAFRLDSGRRGVARTGPPQARRREVGNLRMGTGRCSLSGGLRPDRTTAWDRGSPLDTGAERGPGGG